jgi:hypothetical protein
VSLLELGVAGGYSLLLWRDYLVNGVVHGVDRRPVPEVLEGQEGVVYHRGDLGCREWVLGEFGDCCFDVVVDDASHELGQMVGNFGLFWPLVAGGGVYVVEDVLPEFVGALVALCPRRVEVFDLRGERLGRGIPDNILIMFRNY